MKEKISVFILLFISLIAQSVWAQNCPVTVLVFQPGGNCSNQPLHFITNYQSGDSCVWTYPNNQDFNFSYNDPMPYISSAPIEANGNYTCTIYRANGCVDSSTQIAVVINPIPFVYISGPSFACFGDTTYLTALDASGSFGPYTYTWDNGFTTQSIPIAHNGGIYPHPSCYITNSFGCTAPNYTSFFLGTVFPPISSITTTDLTEICKGDSVVLQGPPGPGLYYQWLRYGSAIAGANGSEMIARKKGKYKLILTNFFGCSDTSDFLRVTVYDKPQVLLNAPGGTTICSGDSVLLDTHFDPDYNYVWLRNGVTVGNSTHQYYAQSKGNYRVLVTNQFDCNRLSEKIYLSNTNCRDDNNITPYSIFPNPSNHSFTCLFHYNEKYELHLYSSTGTLITVFSSSSNNNTINFGSDLVSGIYLAKIITAHEVYHHRIIKRR